MIISARTFALSHLQQHRIVIVCNQGGADEPANGQRLTLLMAVQQGVTSLSELGDVVWATVKVFGDVDRYIYLVVRHLTRLVAIKPCQMQVQSYTPAFDDICNSHGNSFADTHKGKPGVCQSSQI